MCQPALDEPSSYLKQGSLIWPPAGSKPKRERPAAILASLTPFDLWPTSLLNSFNLHHQLCFCILVISSKWQFQSLQIVFMINFVQLPDSPNFCALMIEHCSVLLSQKTEILPLLWVLRLTCLLDVCHLHSIVQYYPMCINNLFINLHNKDW